MGSVYPPPTPPHPNNHTFRRRLFLVLRYLALGALINILAAWGSARVADRLPIVAHDAPSPVATIPAEAEGYLSDPNYLSMFGADRATGFTRSMRRSFVRTEDEYTRWHDEQYGAFSRTVGFDRFGIPFRSLQFSYQGWVDIAASPDFMDWRVPGVQGGWPFAPSAAEQNTAAYFSSLEYVYPLSPIPLGFALNTAFYAALVWGMAFGIARLRARRRVQRKLCAACGYPHTPSLTCPECGTARTA